MADHIFPQVYEFIKEDKIKESLDFLLQEFPEKAKVWALFSNRYTDLEKKNNLGVLTYGEYNQVKAKILLGLTHELDEKTDLPETDFPEEKSNSRDLVTGLVRDQITFLKSRIRELNSFKIGLGLFTIIVSGISVYYVASNFTFFIDLNLHIYSILLFALYLLIILVSLILIHLTKENLSDNKVKFSTYRKVFRKIKI